MDSSKSGYPDIQNQPPPAYGPPLSGATYPPPAGGAYPGAVPTSGAYPQPTGYSQPIVVTTTGGNCPNCHVGYLVESYSLCGILWLILCFPCGLICFLTMKDKKCGACGYSVSG